MDLLALVNAVVSDLSGPGAPPDSFEGLRKVLGVHAAPVCLGLGRLRFDVMHDVTAVERRASALAALEGSTFISSAALLPADPPDGVSVATFNRARQCAADAFREVACAMLAVMDNNADNFDQWRLRALASAEACLKEM